MRATQALLDDIFADVDAREGNTDMAANSCDEEDDSDLDVPKALPPPPAAQPIASSSRMTPRGVSQLPRGLRTPLAASPALNGVMGSAGRSGGRMYNVEKPSGDVYYYKILWRKPQQKKHKTWENDGFIKIEGSRITMVSEEGKTLGTSSMVGGLPGEGTELRIAGSDCMVENAITQAEFRSKTSCLNDPLNTPIAPLPPSSRASYAKGFKPPLVIGRPSAPSGRPLFTSYSTHGDSPASAVASPAPQAVPAASFYGKPKPAGKKIVIGEKNSKEREAWGGALHDPSAPGAVVMPRPLESEAKRRSTTINDVVIDPRLSEKMREHQKAGVQFMYRCVMGMSGAAGHGCILADEMGLGKTLQTIALIHTLCKQSPFQNEASIISRALVVCPVSLIKNWKKEFQRWAPKDLVVRTVESTNDEANITAFTHHRGINVLVIGYERLQKYVKKLATCQPEIGLVVCDEGHRLKSQGTKTVKQFDHLRTDRRIILTGTLLQNDLDEYWATANFVCPGVFGSNSAFQRQYAQPIKRAREEKCSKADAKKGMECAGELKELADLFIIRRTADVLTNYLPPKTEYVVFVAPSQLQLDVFSSVLGGNAATFVYNLPAAQCLATINLMRKIANSPALLRKDDEDGDSSEIQSLVRSAKSLVSSERSLQVDISGKLVVLNNIFNELIYRNRDEKIVVVSNFTTTLNLVQELCVQRKLEFLRLDGSTPQKQRQQLVDQFNRESRQHSAVFLLSAKAGGVGLNLIGASRLVLFDSDWNPSTDLQAMARIHRDGQKKPVYIYRLLTTNTIDEKIYQRQLTKTGLSDQMMGGGGSKDSKDSFSMEELRDIFTVNTHTDGCGTHDLLGCSCGGNPASSKVSSPVGAVVSDSSEDEEKGFVPASQYDSDSERRQEARSHRTQQAKLAILNEWTHIDAFNTDAHKNVSDPLLYNIMHDSFKSAVIKQGNKKRKTVVSSPSSSSPSDSEKEALDSDDEPVRVPSRRKRKVGLEKKHNLAALAQSGQAGRIMFLFERESKASL